MLADYLTVTGADLDIVRNDAVSVDEALGRGRDGIVISPGPGKPQDAGISVALARAAVAAHRPFLGVCLGHQALALACGGSVGRVMPIHGKIAQIDHDGSGLFRGLPSPLAFTRYHSLAVTALPEALQAQAWSDNGVVMALRHRTAPAHGVQFHPESVASASGHALISRFVRLCGGA